jgi:hypothetical protein
MFSNAILLQFTEWSKSRLIVGRRAPSLERKALLPIQALLELVPPVASHSQALKSFMNILTTVFFAWFSK